MQGNNKKQVKNRETSTHIKQNAHIRTHNFIFVFE